MTIFRKIIHVFYLVLLLSFEVISCINWSLTETKKILGASSHLSKLCWIELLEVAQAGHPAPLS